VVITDTRFFLVLTESLLISVCDNTVRTDSVSTDFHLLRTSFLVPALRTRWIQQTRSWPRPACLCNRDSRLADSCVMRTAIVASWLHNHARYQPMLPSARSIDIVVKELGASLQLLNR